MSREGGGVGGGKTLRKKLSSQDSLNASDSNNDVDSNLPPGRMHAVKGHHRLHGSGNIEFSGSGSAPGTPRSRSRSPMGSLRGGGGGGADGKADGGRVTLTTADGNSSISSLDDLDRDILTDRAGIMDDLSEAQRRLHSSKEFHLPATVNERLSEDTLEDIHAFSDVVRSSNCSRVSMKSDSVNGEAVLEPLDELSEEEDQNSLEEDGDDAEGGEQQVNTVILTNMENLTLRGGGGVDDSGQAAREDDEDEDGRPRAGEDSEAPSAPTA